LGRFSTLAHQRGLNSLGKAEHMSALAVFLGLLLWTWVWGAWGTVLAVPLLVVIKSVCDHVETLKPVGRLMAP
jgi:predicted PurR-regulated permease PerM